MREEQLVAIAIALGAEKVAGWSFAERAMARGVPALPRRQVEEFREQIMAGEDPLGDAFCAMHTPVERRGKGATYTPRGIVAAMFDWASTHAEPVRIVDPGAGSGRFVIEGGRRFPKARLLGIEVDPLAAILARGHLAAAGFAGRSRVILGDYREVELPKVKGRTLFIGNPPYIRHHLLDRRWKRWLVTEAGKQGLGASQLAGLHVHFFLATAAKAVARDFGTFITAAEWLDVNYGQLVRDLLLNGLGGLRIIIIEPTARPFPDAATTGAITCFEVDATPSGVLVGRVGNLDTILDTKTARRISRDRLASESRWSHLTRRNRSRPSGFVELGELCRVHRGQVTGRNKVWIAGYHSVGLPESFLYPTVTRAMELFSAGGALEDSSRLRRVIDLPVDLSEIDSADRDSVDRFLQEAKADGADQAYVARNRKAWWAVRLREPAPILATYMARRSPAFVLNLTNARHLNIAHGLYPSVHLTEQVLANLASYLSRKVRVSEGRTYAGGLTKFEPREMERLLVPEPHLLAQGFSG